MGIYAGNSGRFFGDHMQNGYGYLLGHLPVVIVGGIARDQEKVGPGSLQVLGRGDESPHRLSVCSKIALTRSEF
jgi:hypothetical protein